MFSRTLPGPKLPAARPPLQHSLTARQQQPLRPQHSLPPGSLAQELTAWLAQCLQPVLHAGLRPRENLLQNLMTLPMWKTTSPQGRSGDVL